MFLRLETVNFLFLRYDCSIGLLWNMVCHNKAISNDRIAFFYFLHWTKSTSNCKILKNVYWVVTIQSYMNLQFLSFITLNDQSVERFFTLTWLRVTKSHNSDCSGLSEPENPTRTRSIFPNPKKLEILKPKPDKTRKLKKFQYPKAKIIENVHFRQFFSS